MKNEISQSESIYYKTIIDVIKKRIATGELKVGDVLPSERNLAATLKVSRVPVREAIKTLEYMGVLKQVKGKGYVIQNTTIDELYDKISFAIEIGEGTIAELFELRELIETMVVRLACKRRTDRDLFDMKQAIELNRFHIENNCPVETDSNKFHEILVSSARNNILKKMYMTLSSFLQYSKGVSLQEYTRKNESLEHHERIYNFVLKQDSDGAEEAMRQHLRLARDYVISREE